MLIKAIKGRFKFICGICGQERFGSEEITCGHKYEDYKMKKEMEIKDYEIV